VSFRNAGVTKLDEAYLNVLGRAVWAFAVLEWNAVWLCEYLEPGYLNKPGSKGRIRSSDNIADDSISLLSNPSDTRITIGWLRAARDFKRLVKIRNSILHGQPSSTPSGEQSLFREGVFWSPTRVNDAVAQFEECRNFYEVITTNSTVAKKGGAGGARLCR
jgi:hypothetical protein